MPDTTPGPTRRPCPHCGQPAPALLTMKEAGALLRVSDQTIRRYIRAGRLPAKTIPGTHTVLLDQADVLALLVDTGDA